MVECATMRNKMNGTIWKGIRKPASETGVESDSPFCWGLSLGKTNSVWENTGGLRFKSATFKLWPCFLLSSHTGNSRIVFTSMGCLNVSLDHLMLSTWIFISSVGSLMFLQLTWLAAFVATDRAVEWFVTSVGYFMFIQATWCWGFITLEAAEWFITVVSSSMLCQITWCWAFVVTLWKTE